MLSRVREWLVHRVFYSALLVTVALGLLAGISLWITFASRELERMDRVPVGESQAPLGGMKMVVTQLVAREVSSGTSSAEVRAATAQLLEGGKTYYLEQVEIRFTGAAGQGAPGLLSDATGPGFFRADEGWVDFGEGSVLLAGNIYGRRESDGLEMSAERLEYEAPVDEIRLFEVWLRTAEFDKRDPFVVTDSGLRQLRSGAVEAYRSKHPFFQRYGGGKIDD